MKISIIYPSRQRFHQCQNTLENWFFKTSLSYGIQWIISVDESDPQLNDYKNMSLCGPRMSVVTVLVNDNHSAIEAINNAAKIATGDLLMVISDDFDCEPQWDLKLMDELSGKSDFVLKTDDEYQPTLVSLPIMDRIFYERYGYIYHPDYLHMFCDQEMTAIALMTGKYLKSTLKFPHHHYTTGKTEKDEINVKNDMTWKQGQRLFDRHLENNFGIMEPVMQYSEIQWR